MKKTQLTFTIQPELKKLIKIHCAEKGLSITALLEKLLTRACSPRQKKAK